MRRFGGRSRSALAVLLVVGLLAGGSIAYSAMSAGPSAIHACYSKTTGAVRITTKCKSTEFAITWNKAGANGKVGKTGPPGTRGKAGPQGPGGPTGATGPTG